MRSSIIITTLLAAVNEVLAAPSTSQQQYYGVSIGLITSPGTDPKKVLEPGPAQLNVLAECRDASNKGCSVSELMLQDFVSGGLDINTIECRGYKDFAGVVPGSAPFTVHSPAFVSTNLTTISSVLCYVTKSHF